MAHMYIALVDTPGFFASLIRRFLGQRYIHVVIAQDEGLEEAYSVGRRNPAVPVFAGFEKEEKERILHAFPTAHYRICEMECTDAQKSGIMRRLRADYQRRFRIHYAVLGLPFILMNLAFFIRNQYTCSSYIARILQENGIKIAEKHFSLVTPKDFYECDKMRVVFEGKLSDIVAGEPCCEAASYGMSCHRTACREAASYEMACCEGAGHEMTSCEIGGVTAYE